LNRTDGTDLRPLSRGYARETAVIADIRELAALPPREFWRRSAITDYEAPGCPRLESLVYWVRAFVQRGDLDSAWRMMDALKRRIDRAVTQYMGRVYGLSRDQREEMADTLVTAFYEEWLSDAPAHEFWEIRFQVCLKRRLMDAVDRHRRTAQREVVLTPPDEEENPSDPLEQRPDLSVMDSETAAIVRAALDSLPEPLRAVFYLYHHDEWTEEDIAGYLGVTSRTVRNYLTRAREMLQVWR
jgi:RNA polymerase sigma factor (sigma-70 family)